MLAAIMAAARRLVRHQFVTARASWQVRSTTSTPASAEAAREADKLMPNTLNDPTNAQ